MERLSSYRGIALRHTSLATVAVSHINRQKRGQKQLLLYGIRKNSDMENVSEYVQTLSCEARARYIIKVLNTGLSIDPYSISNELWQKELDALPRMEWSDMFLYCVLTQSPFTREEIKVSLYVTTKF